MDDVSCKHKCKDKQACAHACCKRESTMKDEGDQEQEEELEEETDTAQSRQSEEQNESIEHNNQEMASEEANEQTSHQTDNPQSENHHTINHETENHQAEHQQTENGTENGTEQTENNNETENNNNETENHEETENQENNDNENQNENHEENQEENQEEEAENQGEEAENQGEEAENQDNSVESAVGEEEGTVEQEQNDVSIPQPAYQSLTPAVRQGPTPVNVHVVPALPPICVPQTKKIPFPAEIMWLVQQRKSWLESESTSRFVVINNAVGSQRKTASVMITSPTAAALRRAELLFLKHVVNFDMTTVGLPPTPKLDPQAFAAEEAREAEESKLCPDFAAGYCRDTKCPLVHDSGTSSGGRKRPGSDYPGGGRPYRDMSPPRGRPGGFGPYDLYRPRDDPFDSKRPRREEEDRFRRDDRYRREEEDRYRPWAVPPSRTQLPPIFARGDAPPPYRREPPPSSGPYATFYPRDAPPRSLSPPRRSDSRPPSGRR